MSDFYLALGSSAGAAAGLFLLTQLVPPFVEHLFQSSRQNRESTLRIIEAQTATVNRYSEQYYLPMVSKSRQVVQSLDAEHGGRASEAQLEEEFFRLARWVHGSYVWWKEAGGIIILGNRSAETLILALQGKFVSTAFSGNGMTTGDRHQLTRIMQSRPELGDYFSEFKGVLGTKTMATLFTQYKNWRCNLDADTRKRLKYYLQGFLEILHYEVNRAYDPWYGTSTPKPVLDAGLLEVIEVELKRNGELSEKDVSAYLKRIRK